MTRSRIAAALIVGVVTAGVTACGGEPDDESVIVEELQAIATGLAGNDGPLACSKMQRSAQEAFAAYVKAANCIEAVAGVDVPAGLTDSAQGEGAFEVSIESGLASVTGPGADALAEAIGLASIELSKGDDAWMLQAPAEGESAK